MSPIIESNCSVTNLTKGKLPSLPFVSMKEAVLGKKYNLSIVFTTRAKIRALNRIYRDKDAATDILSFPLSDIAGEIHLNLNEAKKESKKFGRDFENFIGFLFIHGLVHLEGFEHGSRMEAQEIKFRKQFGI
ncbi:MAG: rRNA maturation RNase YbeY [Candidatus Liptonbacteria bacterium]|nr:rRNA maturation RNase YbeY [Candidatus Liptonbacteria bacterium]